MPRQTPETLPWDEVSKTPPTIHPDHPVTVALARVSTQLQDHALQFRALLSWGVDKDMFFVEKVSGASKRRPIRDACLRYLKRGDTLVVWKLDRFGRDMEEVLKLAKQLKRRGIKFICVTNNLVIDPKEGKFSMTMMILGIFAMAAEMERLNLMERTAEGVRTRVASHKWHGGLAPFGFDHKGEKKAYTLVVNMKEARILKWASRELLGGRSMRSIIRDLNNRGSRMRSGGKWTLQGLKRVLLCPAIAGLVHLYATVAEDVDAIDPETGETISDVQYRTVVEETLDGDWEAIITPKQWKGVVAALTNPERKSNNIGRTRRYLGTGYFRCGKCANGTVMYSMPKEGKRRYTCYEKAHLARGMEAVDNYVEGEVVAKLKHPKVIAHFAKRKSAAEVEAQAQAQVDLEAKREELEQLRAARKAGLLASMKALDYGMEVSRLEEEIEALGDKAEDISSGTVYEGVLGEKDVEAAWAKLDVHRKHEIVRSLVTVTILPTRPMGRRFDPSAIDLDWHGLRDVEIAAEDEVVQAVA